jgi:hypothetical protein
LESKTYDIKISVESDSQILSEIFDQSQNSWQSSNYYLKEYFTDSSFSGNFKLKIKATNFIGDAKIFAKIRDSKNQKIVAQFEDRIKIKQEEIALEEKPPSQLEEKTSSQQPQPTILLQYPNEVSISNENGFEVKISLSYLPKAAYDIKISVQDNEGKDLTRICYLTSTESCSNSSEFKSSYYYLTNIFEDSSFSGIFKLIFDKDKIKDLKVPFEAQIIGKIRKNGTSTATLEYSNKIILAQ